MRKKKLGVLLVVVQGWMVGGGGGDGDGEANGGVEVVEN